MKLKICLCCRRYFTINNVSLTLTITGIISSIVTIIVFATRLSRLSEYDYLYDYHPSICRPLSGRAYNLSCSDSAPTERWISVLQLENQLEAVENPFAFRVSRAIAITDRDKIDMFSNYSCLCHRFTSEVVVKGCSYWPSCILDADFIHYMQRDNDRYYQTYISFIVASAVSLILSAVSVPFSICIIRRELRHEYVPLS